MSELNLLALAVLAHPHSVESHFVSQLLLLILVAPAEDVLEIALAFESIEPFVAIYRLSEILFYSTGCRWRQREKEKKF